MPEPNEPLNTVSAPQAHSSADATAAGSYRGTTSEFNLGAPMAPGEVGALGPYRVVKELGKGGMGAVYLAVDTRLDRKLALKVMLPEFASNKDAKDRFIREAKAVAKIGHDNVVTIYEADERDGVPYIAMQFLQGYPLDDFLKKKGSPPIAHCVRIGIEAARGLAAAHALGLVHRDIKPANLWLEAPNGRVKVLDFGLAKPVGTDSELTKSGAVVGTPAYMSPEQARGSKVDARTDIFSLGTVMYRLLTGKNPFVGENIMAVLMALGMEEPTPIRELNPSVPEALAAFVMRMLAKKPEARPQTASDVAQGLRAALAQPTASAEVSTSMPVVVQPVPVPQVLEVSGVAESAFANLTDDDEATEAEAAPVAANPVAAPRAAKPKSKVPLIAGGVLALVAVVGVAIALGTGGKKPDDVAKNDPPVPQPKEKGKDAPPKSGGWVPSPEWKPVPVGASPFDKLDSKEIPQDERFAWQPKELVAVVGSHKGRMWGGGGACFSPDGKLVAAGSKPVIWDFETQSPKWDVNLPANVWATPFAFSPDGKRLYLSEHAGVLAFDLTTDGPKPHKTKPDGAPEHLVKFVGHGSWALAEGGKTLVRVLWSEDKKAQKTVCFDISGGEPRETSSLMALELTCAPDANQVVYRAPDGKVMRAAIKNGVFGPGEELAIGADEKACRFTLSPDGTRLGVRTVHSPEGGTDIWDVTQTPPKKLHALSYGGWSAFGFSRDGHWLASTYTFTDLLRLSDEKPKVVRIDDTGTGGDNSAAFSADGTRAVSVSDRGIVRFFDLKGPEPKEVPPFDPATAFRPPFLGDRFLDSPKGRLTLSRYDRQSQVWALTGAKPVPFPNAGARLEFRPARPIARDRWLSGGHAIHSYGLDGEKGFKFLTEIAPASEATHVSPDGTLLVRVAPSPVRLEAYDLSGAAPVAKWALEPKEHPLAHAGRIFLSPDNRWLAHTTPANGGAALAVWRVSGSKPEFYASLPLNHTADSYRVAFSPDGKLLAHPSTGFDSIVVEDLAGRTPREVNRLTGGPPRPNDWNLEHGWLSFHPDGKKLVAVSRHVGVRVVDALAGTVLWQWDPPTGASVSWAEFAHDGRHLFVHLSNNTIYVLRLDLTGAIDRAAVEWLMGRNGGTAQVSSAAGDRSVKSAADIPKEAFRIRGVWLGGGLTDAELAHFGGCRHIEQITLHNTAVSDAGLAHLSGCANLWHIDLHNTHVTDAGLERLATHAALRWVKLVGTKVTKNGVEKLAKALPACKIEWDGGVIEPTVKADADRKAAEWVIGAGGSVKVNGEAREIGKLADLPADVRTLDWVLIFSRPAKDDGLALLGACKHLKLASLNRTGVTDEGLAHLAKCPALEDIGLEGAPVTDAGLSKFKDHPALKSLFLVNTTIGDASLEALKGCPKLERVCLGHTRVSDAGLAHLKDYKALNDFYMWGEKVTDVAIARAAECKTLTQFGFGGIPLTDSALEHVAKMDKLVFFNSTQTKATKAGMEKLAKALPKCKIAWDGGVIEPRQKVGFAPLDPVWLEKVRALKPDEQAKEVGEELKRRNPDFDPAALKLSSDGNLLRLTVPTDHVADLTPVRAFPVLRALNAEPTHPTEPGKLSNLEPLRGLRIEYLNVRRNRVTDLSPLVDSNLDTLTASGQPLADLTPLRGLKLKALFLGGTAVTSVASLEGMKLQKLQLGGTKVTDLKPLLAMPLRELTVPTSARDQWSSLRALTTLDTINEKPAAEFWKAFDDMKK